MGERARRDRAADAAAAARLNATSEGAALSMTAGNMMLGAALAGDARATPSVVPDEAGTPAAAVTTETAASAPPPEPTPASASPKPAPAALPPLSPSAQQPDGAPEALPTADLPAAALPDDLATEQFHETGGDRSTPDGATLPVSGTATAIQPMALQPLEPALPASAEAHHPELITDGLTADLGAVLDDLTSTATELSAMVQPIAGNIAISLDQLASQLETIVADLPQLTFTEMGLIEVPDTQDVMQLALDTVTPVADDVVQTAQTSISAAADVLDATAGSGASVLDALPTTLLGAPDVQPAADGILAQAFGTADTTSATSAAGAPDPSEEPRAPDHANPITALDADPFGTDGSLSIHLGFIGQSYVDALDPHDLSQNTLNSPLHGLV